MVGACAINKPFVESYLVEEPTTTTTLCRGECSPLIANCKRSDVYKNKPSLLRSAGKTVFNAILPGARAGSQLRRAAQGV